MKEYKMKKTVTECVIKKILITRSLLYMIIITLVLSFSSCIYIEKMSDENISTPEEVTVIETQNDYIILTDIYNLNISKNDGGVIYNIYYNNENLLISPDKDNMGIKYYGTARLHHEAPTWYDQYSSFDVRDGLKNFKIKSLKNNGKNILFDIQGKTGDLKYDITYNFAREFFYVNTSWELYGLSIFSILQYVIPFDIREINGYTKIEDDNIIMKKNDEYRITITGDNYTAAIFTGDIGDRYNLNFHLDNPGKYNTVKFSNSKGNFSFRFEFTKDIYPSIVLNPSDYEGNGWLKNDWIKKYMDENFGYAITSNTVDGEDISQDIPFEVINDGNYVMDIILFKDRQRSELYINIDDILYGPLDTFSYTPEIGGISQILNLRQGKHYLRLISKQPKGVKEESAFQDISKIGIVKIN